jgi:hypothetical protein
MYTSGLSLISIFVYGFSPRTANTCRAAEWKMQRNDPHGGDPVTVHARPAVVLRQQADGSWRFLIDNAFPFEQPVSGAPKQFILTAPQRGHSHGYGL